MENVTTRINIDKEVFWNSEDKEDAYKHFEKYFRGFGFILDKEKDTCYMDFNYYINLDKEDDIYLADMYWSIEYKYFDPKKRLMCYDIIES